MTNSSFLTQSISGDEPLFSDVDDDGDKSKDKLEVGNECDRNLNIRSESQTLSPRRKRRFKDIQLPGNLYYRLENNGDTK